MRFLRAVTGTSPEHIGRYSLDPAVLAGNIEKIFGTGQVPIGIAGPLLVDGERRYLFLRFNFTTGDAAGQNLTGKATAQACTWIREQYQGVRHFCLESNLATDKKNSQINILATRGKRVTAGGGTGLPAQRECLDLLGCYGSGEVGKLAELVAATVLCGEISLGSAVVAGEWVTAHERLGRNRP